MSQKIPYTHFFDLIHKLLLTFGPILSIVGICSLVSATDMDDAVGIVLCVFAVLLIIAYGIFFRAVPTFLYVLSKFGIALNYKEMNYCHPLFSGSRWYPCDNLLEIPKKERKNALIQIAKELCHKYDGKTL